MGKGGNSKGKAEIDAEMQMNREQIASYEKQAQASLEAAKIQANAQLEAAKAQSKAAIESSKNAALGGIIGSALGANTTHEEIKQWLPHEVGAATIQSWEMAQMWNKTLEMKTAGYQDVAIDWQLSGKKGNTLFSDAQWRSLDMASQTLGDMKSMAKIFGIQSAANPAGVALTREDWIKMNSMKSPSELLKVDPAVAAARKAQFAQWEASMRAQGKGLVVDLYKNPQLGGSSILTMKGKDALLDPNLAPLLGGIMGSGGDTSAKGSGGTTNWDQAINALTQGEINPMTGQIKDAMKMGLVDKYGMINAGVLMTMVPPELQEAPEFNPYKELSPEEQRRLTDEFATMEQIAIDPKLVKMQNLGFGVTKYTRMNEDGSIVAQALEGQMRDPMTGEPINVRMEGQRLQEFYDRMSAIDLMGPTFPGMRAPVTAQQLSGQLRPGDIGGPQNMLTNMSGGSKGQPGTAQPGATMPSMKQSIYSGSPSGPAVAPGPAQTVKPPAASSGEQKPTAGTLGQSLVTQTSKPSGYEGAPLAAGGE